MTEFTPWSATLGGAMIGLAAATLMATRGRIAGISGIAAGAVTERGAERRWRALFLSGLIGGGALAALVAPERFAFTADRSLWMVGVAGLLVGFGTRLGNGCTSGHGVCGLARGSGRSLIATLTFMACGAATVFVVDHLLGGAS